MLTSWGVLILAALASADERDLFDGKSLSGWNVTDFGGQGEVIVENGAIVLDMGSDLTGITWKDDKVLPTVDYEISLEARRTGGGDFFCGLTFPVKESFCSLIVGGWGGGLVGLSSLDGRDASDNETSSHQDFDDDRWYTIRVRVESERIRAWINDATVVDASTKNRAVSIRPEVRPSRPLGIATWRTRGEVRKIQIRRLDVSR
jgi:hypothetical protein